MRKNLTWQIVAACLLGAIFGLACHALITDAAHIATIAAICDFTTSFFLRSIKMLIAPLVFASLLSGIGRMEETEAVGRIALRAMAWFVIAAFVAMAIGFAVVEWVAPGNGLHLRASAAASGMKAPPFDAAAFLLNIVPTSIADVMARNDVLPIVFFAIVAGLALPRIGQTGADVLRLADGILRLMLQMAGFVMRFAPLAVFAAVATALTRYGAGVIATYASFIGGYYLALALLWVVMIAAGGMLLGARTQRALLVQVRQPALIALATTSSEAAYPSLLQKLEAFGVPNRIAGFVLPLGYAFNLVGSMCYCTFAVLFIAQAYDVPLTSAQIAQLLLMLFVTSKGIANMPRASIMVVAATAPYFSLPEAGVVFVLAIDHFLDMGRTATNVVANAIVAACVAKWEPREMRLTPIIA
ncbi:dicarboxylate/amino acid:cation symporter [Sphingomonas sp. MMS24-J13]|uniref:dicarboxylate/amino acid:cation symporter n=1 Tax=Sphingomonas sp. MMS24-J13 TaxID=3238686 RepID=UPI00384DF24D